MSAPWQLSEAEIEDALRPRTGRDAQIDKIVADTGMDRLQAHYHLQGREAAIAADQRRRAAAVRSGVAGFRLIGEIVKPIVAEITERVK